MALLSRLAIRCRRTVVDLDAAPTPMERDDQAADAFAKRAATIVCR